METNIIYNLDCIEGLKQYPDNFFHCCVTSPPYWRLRDYNVDGQIGQEGNPELFIEKLVEVFREVKRVLRNTGTLWINIADSYYANKSKTEKVPVDGTETTSIKNKELIGIPWMLAFALRKIGFYLRQDIIWHKPNPMPEPVLDRCTKSHEYVLLLSKSAKYYYNRDAVAQVIKVSSLERKLRGASPKHKYARGIPGQKAQSINRPRYNVTKLREYNSKVAGQQGGFDPAIQACEKSLKVNLRSVWTIAAKGFKGNHYATFPLEIPYRCISAGCEENGIVLDPFMGAGTTAIAARKLERQYVGFELNPYYIEIAETRLYNELGLFK